MAIVVYSTFNIKQCCSYMPACSIGSTNQEQQDLLQLSACSDEATADVYIFLHFLLKLTKVRLTAT